MFSQRTAWERSASRLATVLARNDGPPVCDLTVSNPTRCGFRGFSDTEWRSRLACPDVAAYTPDPRGDLEARNSVSDYYAALGASVPPEHIFLAAGTSEAYSHLFRLLGDPGTSVATALPSYPLLDVLADLNDVALTRYALHYDDRWWLDLESVADAIDSNTRCISMVSPNNPTGSYVSPQEMSSLAALAATHGLALISDEVFFDFALDEAVPRRSAATIDEALTFTLGGLSKSLGLPQMKLAWMAVSGPDDLVEPACSRLEVICDTYLSVGAPVQLALPGWMAQRDAIQDEVRDRLRTNMGVLRSALGSSVLRADGGWSAVLRVPRTVSDEAHALRLLERDGILVEPGSLYGFAQEGQLVVSLLVETLRIESALPALAEVVSPS